MRSMLPGKSVGRIEHRVIGARGNLEVRTVHLRGKRIWQVGKVPRDLRSGLVGCHAVVCKKIRGVEETSSQLVDQGRRECPVKSQGCGVGLELVAGSSLGESGTGQVRSR